MTANPKPTTPGSDDVLRVAIVLGCMFAISVLVLWDGTNPRPAFVSVLAGLLMGTVIARVCGVGR